MGSKDRLIRNLKVPNWISDIFRSNRDYPIIDRIVMAYAAIMLFFQILFQISPVMTFLTTTPLYSMQTYLGLLGGILIVVDFFTTKRLWQGKHSIFLYVILVLAALASVRMIPYGMKENMFKLCWAGIQFALVYSCAYRLDRDSLKKYVKILFFVLLGIWFVACGISLYQYVNQIGYMYVVNPLAMDSSTTRQGFYDNRLFGIFYTLNHATYISVFFLLISIAFMLKEKRIWVKSCLVVAELALLCHIILSGSRSAAISLLVCAVVMAWFLTRNAVRKTGLLKVSIPVVVSVLVAVLCVFGYRGMKDGLSLVPYLKEMLVYQIQTGGDELTEAPTEAPIEKPELDEDILVRDHLDEDVSNGRLSIWANYIYLYKDVGLIGLSPGNYMPYIFENYPELYIVDYIKQNYPDKYESGIIYHVHSGYLMVYVSAGILGILSLAAFIVLCLLKAIRVVLKNKRLSYLFVGAFALVVAGAISAALDEGLFFQNNPHTTMFWFALGILMREHLAADETVQK